MIKHLIYLFFMSVTLLIADDLSSLLNDYEDKSQLHNKTKVESAGHLIIYSRDELDKMKAHTLNDVLKSVRSFSLQETSFGQIVLQRSSATNTNASALMTFKKSNRSWSNI